MIEAPWGAATLWLFRRTTEGWEVFVGLKGIHTPHQIVLTGLFLEKTAVEKISYTGDKQLYFEKILYQGEPNSSRAVKE